MKELVIISPSSVYGGGESYIVSLAEVLSTVNLKVLCLNPILYQKLKVSGVRCELLKNRRELFYRLIKYSLLPSVRIVFNGLPESRYYAAIFLMRSFLLITHSSESWGHGVDVKLRHKIRTKINKLIFDRKSISIVAVCEHAKLNLLKNLKHATVYRIYNSGEVPTGIVQSVNEDFTFGFMGRLSEEKGINNLIDMLRRLDSLKLNVRLNFIIAGDGPRRNDIEKLVNEVTSISISYIGFTKPEVFFNQIDCYLLPSLTEGCPIAVIEAMSLGIPTIGSNVGGVSELIKHNENGFLFECQDIDKMCYYILEAASNKSIINEFKENCLTTYNLSFSKEIFSNNYNDLISNKIL